MSVVAATVAEPAASGAAVQHLIEVCERAAQGDFEARVVGLDGDRDHQRLGLAINRLLDVADAYVRESSAAMDSCGHGRYHRPILLRGLAGAFRKGASVINNAGVTMRDHSEQIAFVARLAAENVAAVNAVAAACQELDASTNNIAKAAAGSAQLTQQAVAEAELASRAVAALTNAVRTIDGILALITKVAAQTNLLALNATIEAARAGQHGAGFAVVATEVKELSRSTATATGEIGQQVERMQAASGDVVRSISAIAQSVAQIDQRASAIAQSVDEQVEATASIGRSIADVSNNTTRVSQRVGLAGRTAPAS